MIGPPPGHRRPVIERFIEAELERLVGALEPVEVEVGHGEGVRRVGLHQRERRAGRLDIIAGERADQATGQRRLARAERAREADRLVPLQLAPHGCAEARRIGLAIKPECPLGGHDHANDVSGFAGRIRSM